MERDRNVTFLIFAEGVKLSDFRGRYLKLLRNKPMTFWFLCWAWVAEKGGGSRFRHVLVGDGEVVYDNQYGQTGFWPWELFVRKFPKILGYYMIEGEDPMIATYPAKKRTKWGYLLPIPFLTMAATRGLYQVFNCTTSCKTALRAAGVGLI